MERQLGDKFEVDGCVYEVVVDDPKRLVRGCEVCAFPSGYCSDITDVRGACTRLARNDGLNVHFVRLGGGTEPWSQKGGE